MMTTVGVKLEEELRARLKMLGETRQRSAHWLMKEAIRQYLDREEEQERRNREADAAWEEYQETGQYASHDAVSAWLDTWGTEKEGPCPALENRR
jgi:predicted transcriptional regulator